MPLALILLAGFELSGASHLWLHVLGSLLFVSRVLHAMGLSQSIGTSKPRVLGTLIMFAVLIILATMNIFTFIS
jgi:uncharacterized membrane protein YecN with MAPEG domain